MNHNDLSQCRVDTDRLLIAPFTAADADDVYQAITPTLTRFMTFEPEASPEDFANVWQGWLPLMREGEEVIFVARRREDRQFVGVGGAHNLRSPTPELGIWVKEACMARATAAKSCRASRAGPASAFSRRTFSTRWPSRIPPAAASSSRWAACWPASVKTSSMTPWSTTCRLSANQHRAAGPV